MEFTAKQIAELLGGRVEGNENAKVHTFTKIEEGKEGAIAFLSNPKYTHFLYDTEASVVLVNDSLELEKTVKATLIRVPNAYEAVARLLQLYESMKPQKAGIDPLAFIHPTAKVADDAYVGAFAYVGERTVVGKGTQIYPHAVVGDDAVIGDNCKIFSNVTIYQGCQLGNHVTIHAGTVIGADGFGFAPSESGYDKIPQIGIVKIADDVEIGANTCVDRSTMGATLIGKGTKLDNLIQVGHNVEIGENTVMAAQGGIAGSTKIGSWCMFGGQVGMAGHIHIPDKTHVGAQAGIVGTVKKEGQTIIGSPAIEAHNFMKAAAVYPKLPEIYKELSALKKEIERLSAIVEK